MKIYIKDDLTIEEVKVAFSEAFPGLKIEFVKHGHQPGQGSSKSEIITGNPKLWELRKFHTEFEIEINENQKVEDIEGIFHNKFGLNIQLFRKSGNVWIETVHTDNWTLKEQMQRSAESQN